MRKLIPLKFFSALLLAVILVVTVNGVHDSACAMQSHLTSARDHALSSEVSVSHHCPCAPVEQHNECDGCDACANCACHAPLTVQPFQLSYNPSMVKLNTIDPFKFLPEVYLSKFIPPQIHA